MATAMPTLAATYTPSIKLTNVATTTLSGNQNPGAVQTPTTVPSVPQNTGSGHAADQPNILLITLASATGLLLVAATFLGLAVWRRRTSLASEGDVPLPLPVGAGAIAPAYEVAGSEVPVPAEPPDSSSSGLDPSLEAIMRQAQAGLFVLPGRCNT